MLTTVLAAGSGLLCGILSVLGVLALRALRQGKSQSVTRLLYISTQLAALGWVSVSYGIAIYATVRLGQAFPVVELSQQAITTILGVSVIKTAENIFEHNNSSFFGQSDKKEDQV